MHHPFAPRTTRWLLRAGAVSLLVAAFTAPAAAAPGWSVSFDGRSQPAQAWMKANGWEEQRGDADRWRVADGALHTSQDEDSTTIGTERGFPLSPQAAPRLRMRFKVTAWPEKGDLRRKGTEDAALRVFVIFDRGGGLISPPDTLGYAFASTNPVGRFITSARFDNVKYIPVATAKGYDGGWIEVERDIVADYTKAFGKAPPRIKAIGIKSDGNNTDAKAAAVIDRIELLPR